jgi:hypothetical protein
MKEYTFVEDDGEANICIIIAENHDQAIAKAQARNLPVDFQTDFYSETIDESVA